MRLTKEKKMWVEKEEGSSTATYNGDALVADVRQSVLGVTSRSHEKIGWFLLVKLGPYTNVEAFACLRGLNLGHLRHS